MNDSVREKLQEIIVKYGTSLCDDPKRCEGLLRDLCGSNRLEINVLILALKERIPAELLAQSPDIPLEMLVARLSKRLQDNYALAEAASEWAVQSWVVALGRQKYVKEPEPVVERKITTVSASPEPGISWEKSGLEASGASPKKKRLTSDQISKLVSKVVKKYQQKNFYARDDVSSYQLTSAMKWSNIEKLPDILAVLVLASWWRDSSSVVFSRSGLHVRNFVMFAGYQVYFISWKDFMNATIASYNSRDIEIGDYLFNIDGTEVDPQKLMECLIEIQKELLAA